MYKGCMHANDTHINKLIHIYIYIYIYNGKVLPLQARCGPEGG